MKTRLTASYAAALILSCTSLAAQQADRSRTEALARRGAERLQELHAEAQRLASQERTLLGDLRKLEVEREIKIGELQQANARADIVTAELTDADARVARLDSENLSSRPELRARIVELYKLGQARYLHLLLATTDVRRLGDASRMVVSIAMRDRTQVTAYRRRLDQLRASRAMLQSRAQELAELRIAAEAARVAADRAVTARAELIRRIDTERDLNAALAGELQAAQQKLQTTLRDIARGGNPREPAALPLKPFRGGLEWPAAGTLQARFGQPSGAAGAVSRGIEIGPPAATQVSAVHDGTVAFAGSFTGLGNLVILDHGASSFSLYGNLSEMSVGRGSRVNQGQTVGSVDGTESGALPLYFELRIDGQPVDPLQWLKSP